MKWTMKIAETASGQWKKNAKSYIAQYQSSVAMFGHKKKVHQLQL